ncbi:septum formation family protein [Actinomadura sp. KC06]|uniref:septum formation family protein n=1 Tax=Actinomadura sp. KC06 TaxID=2530369 RepID=UPI001404D634|nr:septum formation family protein [Actinomadura sp. KC06]
MSTPLDDDATPKDPASEPEDGPARRTKRLAIGALATGLIAVGLGTGIAVLSSQDPKDSRPAGAAAGPRVSALTPEDCFTGLRQDATRIFARKTPCDQPHQGEIGIKASLPAGPFPGDGPLASEAQKRCKQGAASLYEAGKGGEISILTDRPDSKAWEGGDRAVTCVLRYVGGDKIYTLQAPRTYKMDLVAGDCVREWDMTGSVVVVDCDTKHLVQVYGIVQFNEVPTLEEREAAFDKCTAKVFGKRVPKNISLSYEHPGELGWQPDEAKIICLLTANKGTLNRSLVPK